MPSLSYTCATTRQVFQLNSPDIYSGDPNDLRSVSWDYKAGFRDISYSTRGTREAGVTMALLSLSEADSLRQAGDADVAKLTPGTLEADGWMQRAYVVGVSVKKVVGGGAVAKVTFLLLDGVWRKGMTYEFRPGAGSGTVGMGHGYKYGYPYGYPYSVSTTREITVPQIVPSPFRIIVYGTAARPSVSIGGNRYQVNTDVPSGGYLVIDSIEGTVTKVAANGYRTNCLPDAVLGNGIGSGSYIFEDVPAGTSTVSYDGSFGWDLTVYREEGAVPWTSS